MITEQKIKQVLYSLIRGSMLHREVTGGIYKTDRPLDSDKEDIVINVSANQMGQIQAAYANVNVYVQDVRVSGQYVENINRTDKLSELCEDLFNVIGGADKRYRITLESQHTAANRDTNEHYINNRLLIKVLNL